MGDDSNDVSVYAGHISSLLTRLGWSVSLVRLLATVRWLANLSSATTSLITILCFFLVAFSRLFCFFLFLFLFCFSFSPGRYVAAPFIAPFQPATAFGLSSQPQTRRGTLYMFVVSCTRVPTLIVGVIPGYIPGYLPGYPEHIPHYTPLRNSHRFFKTHVVCRRGRHPAPPFALLSALNVVYRDEQTTRSWPSL